MIQAISRMAATNSYPSRYSSNHHHHSSPAHLDVSPTPRAFTSPQAPYAHHEKYSNSRSPHRHTAPLHNSYPQHVGNYRDDRRYSESRTSGNRPADSRYRQAEQRPRTEVEFAEQTGNYRQTVEYDHTDRRPSGEESHHFERPSTGDQRHSKRRATDYAQGNRHQQISGGESYHSTPEVGSGGYKSLDGSGPRSWEQPQSLPPPQGSEPSSSQRENLNRHTGNDRSPLLERDLPPSTHSSLPSTMFQSYPQSSAPPSFQSHSQSNIPPSSYQPHSQSNVFPSSTSYQTHSQSNVSPFYQSHSQSGVPASSPSSTYSSAPPTYQPPHSRSGAPSSSSAHSSSLPHEHLHNRAMALSAQTRSLSDNSFAIPGGGGGGSPKGALKSTRSDMDIPTPNTPHSPLLHSSEAWASSHRPVHPDPQTTGGPSSPQRQFDSGSPRQVPTVPDTHTASTKQALQTNTGSPGSSGMSPDPSELPRAGASPTKRSSHSKRCLSKATLENERYSLDGISRPDHDNEDRDFFREESDYTVLGVFDGHDGSRASGFASSYMRSLFDMPFWSSIMNQATDSDGIMREALGEFFRDTESQFFKSIQPHIDEKNRLQRIIPQHLSSYAAYQQFPYEVSCLQNLEPKLTGGCTAVLAILLKNKLYVANAGDSRALLVREQSNGTLVAEQLTQDHSVESEEELRRLEALGLDPRELIKAGRLGMHENTRSIGDYSIKQGYKEVDILRSAKSAPGIATPYIMPTKTIDGTCKYLILMTDGVYKSIESAFENKENIDANKVLLNMLDRHINSRGGAFENTADEVLARVTKIHRDTFTNNSRIDPRSDLAVGCRKRDDMTLLVYKFPDSD